MGPLTGYKVVEMAGIGPGPFGCMMLADLGAEVLRVARPKSGLFGAGGELDFLNRGKHSVEIDVKSEQGIAQVKSIISNADALVEGFRPGVMEKLGLSPQVCMELNPALVYGRITGWGQEGPLAKTAGHDINYIALAGALHPIGRAGAPPTVPLNLVGDFGGGGLLLALGVVSALLEASKSGEGQVVDAAMIDGAALLMCSIFGAYQTGGWSDDRGTNMLDSGSPIYDTYRTADDKYISIGCLEPQFYAQLMQLLGLGDGGNLPDHFDKDNWPFLREKFSEIFITKTQAQWCDILSGTDVCFAPVLSMEEVRHHPHHLARETFVTRESYWQPNAAPRFGRTATQPGTPMNTEVRDILPQWGLTEEDIETILSANQRQAGEP